MRIKLIPSKDLKARTYLLSKKNLYIFIILRNVPKVYRLLSLLRNMLVLTCLLSISFIVGIVPASQVQRSATPDNYLRSLNKQGFGKRVKLRLVSIKLQYVPIKFGIMGSMEMSSFLPNSEFAADNFLIYLPYAIESS